MIIQSYTIEETGLTEDVLEMVTAPREDFSAGKKTEQEGKTIFIVNTTVRLQTIPGIDPEQVRLFNNLLENAQSHEISSIQITKLWPK